MTNKKIPNKTSLEWLGRLMLGGPCNYALHINNLIKIGRTSNFIVRISAHLRTYQGRTKTIFVIEQASIKEMQKFELLLKQYCAPYLLKNFDLYSSSHEEFHPSALPVVEALMNEQLTIQRLEELKPIRRKKYELRYLAVEQPTTKQPSWIRIFKMEKASLEDRMAIYQLLFFSDQKRFKSDPRSWMQFVIKLLGQFNSVRVSRLCVMLIHVETRKYYGIEPYCLNPRSILNSLAMRLDIDNCSRGIKVSLEKTDARTVVRRIELILQKKIKNDYQMTREVLCASAQLLQSEGLLTIYESN